MSSHPIVHLEVSAKDPAAAAKFYSEMFGWKIEVDPQFNYHMFSAEGGPGGGFVEADGKNYKAGDIVPYIDTEDIAATLKKIETLGGRTLTPKTEIPGMGWYAIFADPTGNHVGLFTSMRPQN
jgi:hypothetical protein